MATGSSWTSSLPATGTDLPERVTSSAPSRRPAVVGHLRNEKERFYVLDLPSGDTVTIVIDEAQSASGFRSLIDQAAPVVESFRFLR